MSGHRPLSDCLYTHTHTHTHMRAQIHTYKHMTYALFQNWREACQAVIPYGIVCHISKKILVVTHASVYLYIYIYMCVCVIACHISDELLVVTHASVYVCMCICMCVCDYDNSKTHATVFACVCLCMHMHDVYLYECKFLGV